MKSGKIVTFVCIILFAIACFVWSFFNNNLPPLIPMSVNYYKYLRALQKVLFIFPAMMGTAFLLDYAIYFGRNPEGSESKYSTAMFSRFQKVIVVALFYTFLISMSNLVFLPKVNRSMEYLRQQPALFKMYYEAALENKAAGKDLIASQYMNLALQVNPEDKEVQTLKTEYEIQSQPIVQQNNSEKLNVTVDFDQIPLDENIFAAKSCYELYTKAKESWEKGDWINAHYYARMAVRVSTPTDLSVKDAEKIASEAWKKITEIQNSGDQELAKIYKLKMQGYNAFIRGDYIESYYIFNELKIMQKTPDADVKRFLELAKINLENQYFFIEECEDLHNHESVANMHFAIKRENGTEVYLARGITNFKQKGNLVRYLRDFSITYFDKNGKFIKQLSTPYAKMLSTSTEFLSKEQIEKWNLTELIEKNESKKSKKELFIPYILLSSVSRDRNTGVARPQYRYADGTVGEAELKLAQNLIEGMGSKPTESELLKYSEKVSDVLDESTFVFVPMEFSDFDKIADASLGPENMNLFSLMSFINFASKYGYSTEAFTVVLQEKILYPLSMMLLLLLLANMAWNYRIDEETIFKFKWAFYTPFFVTFILLAIQVVLFVVRQFCLVITYHFGPNFSLIIAIVLEILLLIMLSIMFLSRKE